MSGPTTKAGCELLDAIVAIIDGEWGTGSPMEIAELREEYGEDLRAIEAEAAADSLLRKALETIRDCGPAHPAEDWNLPADRQIAGADCQQANYMRGVARAALAAKLREAEPCPECGASDCTKAGCPGCGSHADHDWSHRNG